MEINTELHTGDSKIIRSTPLRDYAKQLEDYHENDLAEVFPELTVKERVKLCRILRPGYAF